MREVLSRGGFLAQVDTFEGKKWFDRSQYEGYANRLTLVQNLPANTPLIRTRALWPAGVVEVGVLASCACHARVALEHAPADWQGHRDGPE